VCQIGNCFENYYNIDGSLGNGCEYYCVISNSGVEISDGLDNDCDGSVDEGVSSVSPGGGGSSSSIPLICQIGTIKCISSLQYQECLEYGTTNKWSKVKDVKERYQCKSGKIVEIEAEELTGEKFTEETQPAHPKPTEESKETTPKRGFYKTIKNLTWLWLTLIITIITGITIFWLKKKR
jgi:hypothetical protein